MMVGSRRPDSGPIDGWFSIYHRSILPLVLGLPFAPYFTLGAAVCGQLAQRGQHGVLDCGMKVFHVIGPAYADAFGMLDFETEKYRRLGRPEIVAWYEDYRRAPEPAKALAARVEAIRRAIGQRP